MNLINHITTTLVRKFDEATFSSDYPYAVCIWKDSHQQWRAGAQRLTMFTLQHFSRNAPEYLYFDRAKNIYLPRSLQLNELPQQIYEPIIEALTSINSQYRRSHMTVYEQITQDEALIAIEQAAQVIARAHEALRKAGQEPPPIYVPRPVARRPRQQDASPSLFPQWLTSLPETARESLFENPHPQEARESTFSAMLDAYSAASKKDVPASFTSAFHAQSKAPKRAAARAKTFDRRFDFGCAPTMPLPL